jgi:hypothetical protein
MATSALRKVLLCTFLVVSMSMVFFSGMGSAATYTESLLTASDPIDAAEFGRSVATDGDLVVVGAAEGSDAVAVGPGAAYVFRRVGETFVQEVKLVAPDPELGAEFGRAVAVQGDRVVVGARFASSGAVARAGAAYLYRRIGGVWFFEQKVTASDATAEDNFGRAVALENDLLVVTARKEDVTVENDGSAYVFRRRGRTWAEESKLTASDGTDQARFGQSVAIRGKLILVGARDANTPVAEGAGAVYLFFLYRNQWVETGKLIASDGAKGDQFAFNVAVMGNLIIVGARRADPFGLKDAGAVYVYGLLGKEWVEIGKLTAGDAKAGDELGHSVAAGGDLIVAGARRADISGKKDQGAIYLFRRSGNRWIEEAKITASDGEAGDEFGTSLSASGYQIAVGANIADIVEIDQGAVYVYRR